MKYLWLLLILCSCTRDVELNLPPVPPLLVLNATVTCDADVSACLSRSWFVLDTISGDGVTNGTIRVYVNEQFKGSMQLADEEKSKYPSGQYSLPGCRVQPGDRLRLEASAPGFDPIRSETVLPDSIPVISLDTVCYVASDNLNLRSPRMRIYVKFQDQPDKRNYYRLIVEKVTEYWKGDSVIVTSSMDGRYDWLSLKYEDLVFRSLSTNPTLERLDGYTCRGTFTDDLFDGETYTLRSSFTPVQTSFKGDSVTSIVHYDIRLMAISEGYYHYLTVIRNFSISLGDAFLDGLIEPSSTYTNVENGFGVVAGYQVARCRITMPFGDSDPFWNPFLDPILSY